MQNLYEQINNDTPDPEHIGVTQDYGSEAEIEAGGSSNFQIIPPHDPTADAPQRAYPLDQIIPWGERPYLMNILDDIDNKRKYPSFVANRMHQLESQVKFMVLCYHFILFSFFSLFFVFLQWEVYAPPVISLVHFINFFFLIKCTF